MEKKHTETEELMEKIRELEAGQAHLTHEMTRLFQNPKPNHRSASLSPLRRRHGCDTVAGRHASPLRREGRRGDLGEMAGAVKLSDRQYLNILQSMGQAVHIFDLHGRIIYWNRTAEQVFGFSASEALGQDAIELLTDPLDYPMANSIVDRVTNGESWKGQFPVKNKRGDKFVVVTSNTPFYDDDGTLNGIISVSSDLSTSNCKSEAISGSKFSEGGLSFSRTKTFTSAKLGLDPQQPIQVAIASKLSNLATKVSNKVKSKIRTGDSNAYYSDSYNSDHGSDAGNSSGASTPRGDLPQSPFGRCPNEESTFGNETEEGKSKIHKILSSKAEAWMGKKGISWPWKGNEREVSEPKTTRFSWPWLNNDQENEKKKDLVYVLRSEDFGEGFRPTNNEASGSWSSSFNVNSSSSASSCGSTSSEAVNKADVDSDCLDYEILWEDLSVGEQIGQGSCGTVYHALWYGSDVAVKVFSKLEYSNDVILSFRQECMKSPKQNRACGCKRRFPGGDILIVEISGFPLPVSRHDLDIGTVLESDIFLPFSEDPDIFARLREVHRPTLGFIPKTCRRRFARDLAAVIQDVLDTPDDLDKWVILHIFPACILRAMPPVKDKISGGKMVGSRLLLWEESSSQRRALWHDLIRPPQQQRCIKKTQLDKDLKKANLERCRRLVTQGRLGLAARALVSHGVCDFSEEVRLDLEEKHPSGGWTWVPSGPAPEAAKPNWVAVFDGLRSFPCGSAGGRDGLKPQHLLDALAGALGHVEEFILQSALVGLMTLFLGERVPSFLAQWVVSAPNVPLAKKDGSYRPIAVGEVWRRLASKIAMSISKTAAINLLSPIQIGVGVRTGAEGLIHAVNRSIGALVGEENFGLLKIDLRNAFNLVSRPKFFEGVRTFLPGIAKWVEFCYLQRPILYTGDSMIRSECGVQQGDPLGPLLFSIAIHPVLAKIKEVCPNLALNGWYLDDGVLIGSKDDIRRAYRIIVDDGPEFGMFINPSKCEAWWPVGENRDLDFPEGVPFNYEPCTLLLGSAISLSGEGVDALVQKRVDKIIDVLSVAALLHDPHIQLLLLRACCGFPKICYVLRSSLPFWIEGAIECFDRIIDDALKLIWNAGFTKSQRVLVGLPVKLGGMGMPIARIAAFPAIIASMIQSEELQRSLVRADVHLLGETMGLLSEWNASSGGSGNVPIEELRKVAKPQQWLLEKSSLRQRELLVAQGDDRFKTLVNACSAPGSGSWTSALPSPFNGTFMSPAAYRCALRYRTGHQIFSSSSLCLACRKRVSDAVGDHDSFCQGGGRLIRRHNLVRDKLFALARETRLAPRLKVGHLVDGSTWKPADILLPSWDSGRDLCLDVSIVSPFSFLPSVAGVGEATRKAEERKTSKYESQCAANGLIFRPFVMESTGGFGQRTEEVLSRLAVELAAVRGVTSAESLACIRQQLAFTSQKAMADGFLIRSTRD